MKKIKKGDIVSRNSYQNDILFYVEKIIKTENRGKVAILKELDSNYGINPTYHRVVCVSINALRREVTICLASYFSKDIRDNGGQPIETIDINVPSEDYNLFLEGNIYQVSYCWLKENVIGFEEATDI